jgi:hypothetical protein
MKQSVEVHGAELGFGVSGDFAVGGVDREQAVFEISDREADAGMFEARFKKVVTLYSGFDWSVGIFSLTNPAAGGYVVFE